MISVAKVDDIKPGETRSVFVNGIDILFINANGTFYAVEDSCSHDNNSLEGGRIENNEISCPRHGARFCLKTGAVKSPPAYTDIECFKVEIENGNILIEI